MESGGCEEHNMADAGVCDLLALNARMMFCTSCTWFTYLILSQRVAVTRRDGVDGRVEGQPAPVGEVKSAERREKGGMMEGRAREALQLLT